jgi:hypothetical protein
MRAITFRKVAAPPTGSLLITCFIVLLGMPSITTSTKSDDERFACRVPDWAVPRAEFLRRYNADELAVLVFSTAGGEGLNLKGTRFVHLLEPQWSTPDEKQMIARATRFRSHNHLPVGERKVTVFRLQCVTFPATVRTGDEMLREMCNRKDERNDRFVELIKDVAEENRYMCFAHGLV